MGATEEVVGRAVLHARVRWIGAPLLVVGAVSLVWALFDAVGGGPWLIVGVAALGTGLGLASFGANHDTAMALGFRAIQEGALPPGLRSELEGELERDRAAITDLRATPRVALAVPLVAVAIQAFVWWSLVGGDV